jgi:hypothetical protein
MRIGLGGHLGKAPRPKAYQRGWPEGRQGNRRGPGNGPNPRGCPGAGHDRERGLLVWLWRDERATTLDFIS